MTDKPYWQQRRDLKNGKTGATEGGERPKPADRPKAGHSTPKPQKPGNGLKKGKIRKVAKKRAKQLREYKPVRRKFLAEHQNCELRLPGCLGKATEIHHAAGRENGRLLTVDDFKASCSSCHKIATEKSREAIAAGHSKSRLGKSRK